MKRISILSVMLLIAALTVMGCSMSKTQQGALLGGAAGALGGAAVSDDDTQGAIIGGVVGAAVGGIIGSYLDDQAEEMEEIEGARVERIGDQLVVTFDSAILFDVDSSSLKVESKSRLDQMAEVLVKYEETDIFVLGHTDNTGEEDYNQSLSERRSESVSIYLEGKGVTGTRVRASGFGETVPVGDNTTTDGRTMNRRVEVSIEVNEEFKARAAAQE